MVLIDIDSIIFDPLVYPRQLHEGKDGVLEPYWRTAAKMARAQRAGDELPPITVALIEKQDANTTTPNPLLIDGYNRMLAHKQNKRKQIEAQFIQCKDENEAYVEAVKRNVRHGVSLDDYEIAKAVVKLQDLGYSEIQISSIVAIAPLELKRMLNDRVVKTPTGQLVLKRLLVGQQLPANMTEELQAPYSVKSQVNLLRQLNALIEDDLLDL